MNGNNNKMENRRTRRLILEITKYCIFDPAVKKLLLKEKR